MIVEHLSSLSADAYIALGLLANNIHWLVLGALIGMILGVLPGMGGVVTLTILIPFTLGMDTFSAFTLLGAALGATTFGGSITAILVNIPGTGSNAATLLDGYPMTRNGEGARAIGASAFSSAAGAFVGLLVFFLMIPFVIQIAILFGPSEVFWLVVLGLTVIPLVAGDRVLAGLAASGLGLMLAFMGQSSITGEYRFTYGQAFLLDGIELIPALIGLFALAEMFKLSSTEAGSIVDTSNVELKGNKWDGVKDVVRHRWMWLRCSLLGTFIGAIPGVGGSAATFIAYGHAVQSSVNSHEFGTGRVEGVIGSEAANDAKDGGQLFPTLGLGIPGSGSTAVLLGGFLMHGLIPGPDLLAEELTLMLIIVFALVGSNILTSILGLLFTEKFLRITSVPVYQLAPVIIVVGLVATYIVRNSFGDIVIALIFAALGIVMIYLSVSRVPIVIALILGAMLENNYHLAIDLAGGDIQTALFAGTLNQILIGFVLFAVLVPLYQLSSYSIMDRIGR